MTGDQHSSGEGVKIADALGKLSERARVSRFTAVAIAVVGFVVLAIFAGFLFRLVVSGANTPEVPKVEL